MNDIVPPPGQVRQEGEGERQALTMHGRAPKQPVKGCPLRHAAVSRNKVKNLLSLTRPSPSFEQRYLQVTFQEIELIPE